MRVHKHKQYALKLALQSKIMVKAVLCSDYNPATTTPPQLSFVQNQLNKKINRSLQ